MAERSVRFKLGDKVKFHAIIEKTHSKERFQEIETRYISVGIPTRTGIIVGKRTLTKGYLHIGGSRDPYDDDSTYFSPTGGVSVWLVAADLVQTLYVHPANIEVSQ